MGRIRKKHLNFITAARRRERPFRINIRNAAISALPLLILLFFVCLCGFRSMQIHMARNRIDEIQAYLDCKETKELEEQAGRISEIGGRLNQCRVHMDKIADNEKNEIDGSKLRRILGGSGITVMNLYFESGVIYFTAQAKTYGAWADYLRGLKDSGDFYEVLCGGFTDQGGWCSFDISCVLSEPQVIRKEVEE